MNIQTTTPRSVSALGDWERCQRNYLYKRILKQEPPLEFDQTSLQAGSWFHESMERALKAAKGKPLDSSEFLAEFQASLLDRGNALEARRSVLAMRVSDFLFHHWQEIQCGLYAPWTQIEAPFALNAKGQWLNWEGELNDEPAGTALRGYIDWAFLLPNLTPNGGWVGYVLDWKTSPSWGKKVTEDDGTPSTQLALNAFALLALFPRMTHVLAAYCNIGLHAHPEDWITLTRENTAPVFRRLLGSQIVHDSRDAENLEEWPATPGSGCRFCTYSVLCAKGMKWLKSHPKRDAVPSGRPLLRVG